MIERGGLCQFGIRHTRIYAADFYALHGITKYTSSLPASLMRVSARTGNLAAGSINRQIHSSSLSHIYAGIGMSVFSFIELNEVLANTRTSRR